MSIDSNPNRNSRLELSLNEAETIKSMAEQAIFDIQAMILGWPPADSTYIENSDIQTLIIMGDGFRVPQKLFDVERISVLTIGLADEIKKYFKDNGTFEHQSFRVCEVPKLSSQNQTETVEIEAWGGESLGQKLVFYDYRYPQRYADNITGATQLYVIKADQLPVQSDIFPAAK